MMERTKYALPTICNLNHSELAAVKDSMSKEELMDMTRKTREIVGNTLGFQDIKDRALAERFFELGYLAAHVDYLEPYKANERG